MEHDIVLNLAQQRRELALSLKREIKEKLELESASEVNVDALSSERSFANGKTLPRLFAKSAVLEALAELANEGALVWRKEFERRSEVYFVSFEIPGILRRLAEKIAEQIIGEREGLDFFELKGEEIWNKIRNLGKEILDAQELKDHLAHGVLNAIEKKGYICVHELHSDFWKLDRQVAKSSSLDKLSSEAANGLFAQIESEGSASFQRWDWKGVPWAIARRLEEEAGEKLRQKGCFVWNADRRGTEGLKASKSLDGDLYISRPIHSAGEFFPQREEIYVSTLGDLAVYLLISLEKGTTRKEAALLAAQSGLFLPDNWEDILTFS